ncbi:MAG: response regulator transcription factor [Pseudomonadales bacterium]
MSTILLVDDHAVVRAGIKQILLKSGMADVIGEAGDAAEAISKFRAEDWQLVLLDIRLPSRSGVDLLGQFKAEKPSVPVLILSTYPESQYAVRLIEQGAAGYLSKDADESEIIKAISLATRGRRYISPVVAELLASNLDKKASAPASVEDASHEVLSNREYQIFLELASGRGPTEIADSLQLSSKTVTTHRARILRKMGFTTNAELIRYADRLGLLL